jgi:pimeloyl-ACP methyl ester carboxylesterase
MRARKPNATEPRARRSNGGNAKDSDPDYAPFPLTTDETRFGLGRSSATNEFGSATARSRRTDRSRRATIFLHGAAGSWTTWTPLLEAAEEAGVGIPNPILVDLPGWGDGSITPLGRHEVLDAACSLVKELAESLGFTEWDLIGHSMGGFIALHMAATWPEHVLSVGTVSATGESVIEGIARPLRGLTTVPSFILLWQVMRMLARFGHGGTALVRFLLAARLLRPAVGPLFRHPFRVPGSVIRAFAAEVRPASFASAVELARGYDAARMWARIECPVRATQGDADAFSRRSDLDAIARSIPASSRELLVDCGHFGAVERPREVLRALGFTG